MDDFNEYLGVNYATIKIVEDEDAKHQHFMLKAKIDALRSRDNK